MTVEAVEELRQQLLGRSGELTALLKGLGPRRRRSAPSWAVWPTRFAHEVEGAIGERLDALRGAASRHGWRTERST